MWRSKLSLQVDLSSILCLIQSFPFNDFSDLQYFLLFKLDLNRILNYILRSITYICCLSLWVVEKIIRMIYAYDDSHSIWHCLGIWMVCSCSLWWPSWQEHIYLNYYLDMSFWEEAVVQTLTRLNQLLLFIVPLLS